MNLHIPFGKTSVFALTLALTVPIFAHAAPADASTIASVRASVEATAETVPVPSSGDAADDPSIWVHPTDPSSSEIIATDKKSGIYVYDLDGNLKYSYPVGKINNIDVRYDFTLSGQKVDIAAATNKSTNTVDLFTINRQTGELKSVSGSRITPSKGDVYGFALYHSLKTDKYYALVLGNEGEFEQFELSDNGKGRINGKSVRTFQLSSQSEGIVADDEYGRIYIGEEDVAIWRYGAEPGDGNKRLLVASVDNDRLAADIEGLTLYYGKDGFGQLIASSQGNSSYAVFNRKEEKYLGNFIIRDGPHTDGTSGTDGIDVLSFGLGGKYPHGFFVAQDDSNINNGTAVNQNFKIVPWERISEAYGRTFGEALAVDDQVDPRKLKWRGK